ncbi:hypothetical protein HDC92_001764 [Pedobacter sp. AK017]|uniref:hypothetical protein n=1 Tax=Pedobacter sp. AK017 TaxID=2723073 RepID=UPI00161B885C|nr:hypothetical protein [Pedobacter sp. AK017]MBB5438089.1 hypothetical protein [Pedobacter sp. AK017]
MKKTFQKPGTEKPTIQKCYFGDERAGYDILKHYLELISEEKNEMFISSNSRK